MPLVNKTLQNFDRAVNEISFREQRQKCQIWGNILEMVQSRIQASDEVSQWQVLQRIKTHQSR